MPWRQKESHESLAWTIEIDDYSSSHFFTEKPVRGESWYSFRLSIELVPRGDNISPVPSPSPLWITSSFGKDHMNLDIDQDNRVNDQNVPAVKLG